ncbi:S-adenosyl-L-methionine-dependent methyltransferase [Clohesyomyces aquaticus]|uniref:S-adenosyl-L-methionine-dependent methyltransferase n=1 Tax=Clohesyomyces aquaticus TaxID=1231657 RepID=A0A1Y1YYB7_9PLEO|nr:S-adenosyl-L-methionine-dependent methyltransferase [Clohesyomyces aquaticus]
MALSPSTALSGREPCRRNGPDSDAACGDRSASCMNNWRARAPLAGWGELRHGLNGRALSADLPSTAGSGRIVPNSVACAARIMATENYEAGSSQHILSYEEPIPVANSADDDPDVDDSAYGDDALSDTTTIPSTIFRHRYLNGRRYHKFREGEYWGPNDEEQNDQLDIAHHMFTILLDNKLYLAPVENPKRVLDLGCGTGIWCTDVADEHPAAEVIGIDLSPIQPQFTAPNCHFEIDDITSPWTYPPNSFDFIHIRTLYGSIGDWPKLYGEIFDHLEPGGWLNQLEISIQFKSDDGTLAPDHILSQWSDIFHEAGERFGKSFRSVLDLKGWIKEAGFEDVHEIWHKLPVNTWSSDPKMKELGRWNYLHCTQGAEGWGLFLLTEVMKWTKEEAMVFIARFRQGLRDRKVHAYFETVTIYGRKPQAKTA